MALTKRQRELLDLIEHFIRDRGFSPSYEELAKGLGISSLATVYKHVVALQEKGLLRRGFNRSRSIDLIDKAADRRRAQRAFAARQMLPLAGRIAAGKPIEAIENKETISLSDVTGTRDVFVLEVRGDSMIDDHILEGDYVLVEKTERAENGQIVVALVDEDEATLKRLYREKDGVVRLQPANARMQPMRIPAQRVKVQGRVIGVLRKY
jgi:repressor LexA